MINPLKPYLRPDRDLIGRIPWYMGYVYRAEGIRCDVFYVIPLNFVVVWWNRVLFRLQFGPLYSHRMEDEYRRGEQAGRVRGKQETEAVVVSVIERIRGMDGKITIAEEPDIKVGYFSSRGIGGSDD